MVDSAIYSSLAEVTDGIDCNVNIGGSGLVAIWTMTTLAMAVVGVRLYTQARVTKQFGLSDYLMLCSVAVLVAFASLISVQFHFGWGRHQACITDPNELKTQIKFNVVGQSFGIMGSTFGRLSFITFMLGLFGRKEWVRWTLWALFAAQVVTNVGTVIANNAQCKDWKALYDFTMPESLCWPPYVQTYIGWAHTSFNGACDAFLSILPIIMVWNLHMATRLKVGVAVLLGMSSLALVGLIMKCVYLGALSYEGDYSYNTVPMFTWIVVEGTLVAIAASLPLLRPLVRRKRRADTQNYYQNSYDLPRYYAGGRSAYTDSTALSSGGSRLGPKARTSVKGGGRGGTIPRTAVYAVRGLDGLDDGDSEENVLVSQQGRMQGSSPEITTGRRNMHGRIMVRQDYVVTSEAMGEGWGQREKSREGDDGVVHERSVSEQSLESEGPPGPRPPPSAWSTER